MLVNSIKTLHSNISFLEGEWNSRDARWVNSQITVFLGNWMFKPEEGRGDFFIYTIFRCVGTSHNSYLSLCLTCSMWVALSASVFTESVKKTGVWVLLEPATPVVICKILFLQMVLKVANKGEQIFSVSALTIQKPTASVEDWEEMLNKEILVPQITLKISTYNIPS